MLDWPGGSALWWAGCKAAFIVGAPASVVICGLALSQPNRLRDLRPMQEQHAILKDEQIALLAERAGLTSERQVEEKAGVMLALDVPGQEQAYRIR